MRLISCWPEPPWLHLRCCCNLCGATFARQLSRRQATELDSDLRRDGHGRWWKSRRTGRRVTPGWGARWRGCVGGARPKLPMRKVQRTAFALAPEQSCCQWLGPGRTSVVVVSVPDAQSTSPAKEAAPPHRRSAATNHVHLNAGATKDARQPAQCPFLNHTDTLEARLSALRALGSPGECNGRHGLCCSQSAQCRAVNNAEPEPQSGTKVVPSAESRFFSSVPAA